VWPDNGRRKAEFAPPLVLPSLYAADQSQLARMVQCCLDLGLNHFHFDVMDGLFVPAHGLSLQTLDELGARFPQCQFDVHLMAWNPQAHIEDVINKAGALAFHPDSCDDPRAILERMRRESVLAGVAISPALSIEAISPLVQWADYLLVMLIEPGTSAQSSRPELIAKLRAMRLQWPDIAIIADGGIDTSNIVDVISAGADRVVVGGALFKPTPDVGYEPLLDALGCRNAAL